LTATSTARALVVLVVGLSGLLGVALLVASLLPNASLAGRLLGAAGEARAGSYTQDLVTYLGQRMRLAGGLLLVISVGLVVLRAPFEDLVRASLGDLTSKVRWPSGGELLAMAAAALVAIGLRVPFLSQPMRYDEALTFNEFASRPLYYALSFYPDPNNHLLNTLLVHVASAALGSEPWVLRLPAFLAGVLLVPTTYGLARLLYGQPAAFLSAVLVVVSSYLVEYSTNSRGYTVQALCFVGMLSLAIVAVRRDSPTALLLAALVAALGAYAVPTMVYGVAVAAAWVAVEVRGVKLTRIGAGHFAVAALVLGLAVTLAYLPVLLVSGADKLVSNRFVVPLEVAELATELPASLGRTWGFWNRDVPLVVSAPLVAGFLAVVAAEARHRRVPLGILAPVVCLAIVLIQRVAPFERVWLFLLPLYLSVASGGLTLIKLPVGSRLADVGLAGVGCVLAGVLGWATLTSGSILSSPETGTYPDAQAASAALRPVLATDDAVLTTLPASLPELQYYFPREGMRIDALVRSPSDASRLFVIATPGASPAVPGWRRALELARLPGSVVLQFERAQP
jgi:hypothetical protein